MINDFLDNLVENKHCNIFKTILRESINIKELNGKEFYVINDYIVVFIVDQNIVLKIYPEEMCISFYKMWNFFNSRRVLKQLFNNVKGDGNTIIIPKQERMEEIFIDWYSLLLFPVKDQQYTNYSQNCLIIDLLGWKHVVSKNSVFIIPYSLKEHKLTAYTHLGQLRFDGKEFLPMISEGISQISFDKNIKEYPPNLIEKINKSKNMWIENDKLNFTIPSNKNNKKTLVFSSVLRKALAINYQDDKGLWKEDKTFKVDKNSQKKYKVSYSQKKKLLPYYDNEDLNSIKYSSLL